MTDVLLVVGGALAVVLVVWDVTATTLTLGEGAGPLTRRLLAAAWRLLLRVHRRRGGRPRLLSSAGPLLMGVTVFLWVALFWAGWSLVFLGSGSVAEARTGRPGSVADVVYFAGYAVSTLGVGDFVATEPAWRVMTSLASFSGLALVTLSITYLFSVMSAVVGRRATATQLHGLGDSAQGIVVGGWDGDRFDPAFTQQLLQLPAQLAAVAEQHLAYPVLHYFRSERATASAPVAIARLDDAMLLLGKAVAADVRPPAAAVLPVRRVIDRYVATATHGRESPHDAEPPPGPGLDRLADAGIPLGDREEWRRAVDAAAPRRARLRRLVEDAGWEWRE
ncbi:potassium channel family protein [Blastococcus sp. VKM Ac-2987]|uniref:potassium channel family protein n=1 Tax=Blastococcus sp. VKM Ac-2987 TaxID=3004141 RepID=UPI0022AB9F7D|nr:potassium channel family protein [Blastococcus sp. VKM Ac-2987]MCZ2860441.1 potassium channel family protein [Blastococcus sp. VKM Ac-2987]